MDNWVHLNHSERRLVLFLLFDFPLDFYLVFTREINSVFGSITTFVYTFRLRFMFSSLLALFFLSSVFLLICFCFFEFVYYVSQLKRLTANGNDNEIMLTKSKSQTNIELVLN